MGDVTVRQCQARHVRIGQRIRRLGQWVEVVNITPVLARNGLQRGGGYWFTLVEADKRPHRVHYYGADYVEVMP